MAEQNPIARALTAASPRPDSSGSQATKKNYAERLSRHLATEIASALRPTFKGISPNPDGSKQEAPARTAKGFKKLDVNYSTPELGLALGVSIKTLNFADAATRRYTKNYTRIDAELRAEASDYHQRQPYAFMVALLFLPFDSCDDGKGAAEGASSFAAAVRYFRPRAKRLLPQDSVDLFELFYVGLYDPMDPATNPTRFFDVMGAPPRLRRPRADETIAVDAMIAAVVKAYDARNNPPFEFVE